MSLTGWPPRSRASSRDAPQWVPYRRAGDARMIAGVASGLAASLNQPARRIRLAFIGLALAGGVGFVLYAALWLVVPLREPAAGAGDAAAAPRTGPSGWATAGQGRGAGTAGVVLAAAALGAGVLLVVGSGHGRVPGLVLPLLIAGAGVVLVWRQADTAQRERWSRMAPRMPLVAAATAADRRAAILRVASGVVLVVAGGVGVVSVSDVGAAGSAVAAALVAAIGLALIAAPWLWRLASDVAAERRERIRTQERAEVAAHLHDSVLQTLALIRRHADDPREVARLARGQERDLRAWLYGPARAAAGPGVAGAAPAAAAGTPGTVGTALEQAAAEVEDTYGVTVDVVVVGQDRPLDPPMAAVVSAAREAMVNAARHSGQDRCALFAEITPDLVEVFVRDRGAGFALSGVPADRHGIVGSIIGRMQRHGGQARIRTAPGAGTEVALSMPGSDRDGPP